MPAIDRLLKRWGFVRLSRYGLVLTPEDRILSLRPTVLDDGLGGRVVGWEDGDLAAAELKRWESSPAPQPVVPDAPRLVLAPPARPTLVSVPAPVAPTPAPARTAAPAPAPAPVAAPAPAPVAAPARVRAAEPVPAAVSQMVGAVAPQPRVEEDDWEWEISLARARAAADEAEDAARTMAARAPVRPAPAEAPARPAAAAPVRPTPAEARPAPAQPVTPARPAQSPSEVASRLRPVVASRPAASSSPAPRSASASRPSPSPAPRKTLPIAQIVEPEWSQSESTVTVAYSEYSYPSAELERAQSPDRQATPKQQAHRALVARAASPRPVAEEASVAPPRRVAKGTSPVTPKRGVAPVPARVRAQADEPTVTGLAYSDRTATDLALDDRTTPNLPLADRTRPGLALPSIRGRATR